MGNREVYRVVDPGQMERLVGRSNVSEFEIGTPKSLEALHAEGIDALLIVKSTTRSTGRTDAASVRVVSTYSGDIIAGFSWRNGRCGAEGSPCDMGVSKDTAGAAVDIARALRQRLP